MPNILTRNPWLVDTASATDLITDWVDVRSIQWIGGTTAGHEARVVDQNGVIIWRRLAAGANANFDTEFHGRFGRKVNGLRVPNLDSGTLYITFSDGD